MSGAEDFYQTMFERVPMAIVQSDSRTGRLTWVNARMCELTGYPMDELIGRSFTEFTHPDDLADNLSGYARVVQGEISTYTTEKRYVRKNGSVIWVRITAELMPGDPLRTLAAIEDITARKAAELEREQLREREREAAERLRILATITRALSEARLDLVRLFDVVASELTRQIADGCSIYQLSEDGQRLETVACYHNEPVAQGILCAAIGGSLPVGGGFSGQAALTGETVEASPEQVRAESPVRFHAFNDYVGDVWLLCVPLKVAGRVLGVIVVVRDGTTPSRRAPSAEDRQLVEEIAYRAANAIDGARLLLALHAHERELLDAQRVARVGSWSFDLVRGKVTMSDEACRICGRRPGETPRIGANEWAGSPFLRDEDFAHVGAVVQQVQSMAAPVELEVDVLRQDGSARTVAARFEAQRDPDGAVRTVRGTLLDVTERKVTERALLEASHAKDDFLALLGHELQNPLAPIVTALQILKLRRGDSQIEKTLQIVERQVQHLVRLVDDLLDVSRITRGQIQIKRRPIRLQDAVAHGAEMVVPLLERRGHHLEIEIAEPDLRVNGDEGRLAQVVSNLLTNAAKYTDPGGHITVRIRREADAVVLEVEDDGIGIDAELLPHVFELFTQSRQSTDRSMGGLGLGLTIVRKLVEMHGGIVVAASDGLGKGSTFTVRLPRASSEASAIQLSSSVKPLVGSPRKILVVDDNEDALDLLSEVLRAAGHEVVTAMDGPTALDLARHFNADVAILDIGLPVMDGYELATRLRVELGARAPRLIALTGYGQDSDRARAREVGFAEHLTKPVEAGALFGVIDAVVHAP